MGRSKIRSDADWEQLFSKSGIPTITLMTTLPLWACVAFAARCSRRVQPFLQSRFSVSRFEALDRVGGSLLVRNLYLRSPAGCGS